MKHLGSFVLLVLLAAVFLFGALLALPGLALVVVAVRGALWLNLFPGAGVVGQAGAHNAGDRGSTPRPASTSTDVPLTELLNRRRAGTANFESPVIDGLPTTTDGKGAN